MGAKHPMQPVVMDKSGVARFKSNPIVRHLLDHGGIDLNKIAMLGFDREDHSQFAQLIGYSVSGFGDLGYCDRAVLAEADAQVDQLLGGKTEFDFSCGAGPLASRMREAGLLAPGAEAAVRALLDEFGAVQRLGERGRMKRVVERAFEEEDEEDEDPEGA